MEAAPTVPVTEEGPLVGSYAGSCLDTPLRCRTRGVSRFRQAISEKHWQWFCAMDSSLAVGGAVVDAGLFGTAFLWVFDRERGELLADTDVLVPAPLVHVGTAPGEGDVARISIPGCRLRLSRSQGGLTVNGHAGPVSCSLSFEPKGTPVTAIAPVAERNGGVNVTQKETGMVATGAVDITGGHGADAVRTDSGGGGAAGESKGETGWFDIDGEGMTDYTHGLLARETQWRWAIGNCHTETGQSVGFNLVAGFNEGRENAVWIDGSPQAVGTATFETTPLESGAPWHVRTACETVALTLTVEGYRAQDIDIGLLRSQYHQPIGRWSGHIDGREVTGAGVAEHHLARW